MNEERNLEELFKSLQGKFDTELPQRGHEERFMAKLKAEQKPKGSGLSLFSLWQPYAAAAALLLFLTLGYLSFYPQANVQDQVARISPEISQTNLYFTGLIEEQVKILRAEDSPLTNKVLEDALNQLKILEDDYTRMENDLLNGGNSKLILSAMITNFQTRIELLKEVQEQIEMIKNFNTDEYENISI
ncbi:hypothetical protein PP178_10755 [Zeaxanthinibacter sp. PT1]|uniref:hypothetical protein n=1 Tax=Zeaxanthinibacter TaxID=561554 RepID=UPI00234BB065|nr:hypothetical protein [Zeaxanthinibacter sp. PT1]MDC6352035.1 hypothetical protein [Zeaxanthinibacter sp. PT1]